MAFFPILIKVWANKFDNILSHRAKFIEKSIEKT